MKVLDLFSGIGGFSLGLERTGHFETVAFCEIDPFCRQVLAKHWPDVPIHHDIKELTADAIGPVDIIVGGFPCQDISVSGKRAGLAGRRSGLWFEFARLVGELQPRYIVVENTPGLLSLGMGRILGDLAASGYDTEWLCFPTGRQMGHERKRVFIVADNVCQGLPLGSDSFENGTYGPRFFTRKRFAGFLESSDPRQKWADRPLLGRGIPRVPGRVGRVKSCGNAVVPQVVEEIGYAIAGAS